MSIPIQVDIIRNVGFCPHCGNQAPQRLVYTQCYQGKWYSVDTGDITSTPMEDSTYFVAVCETCNQILVYSDPISEHSQEQFTSTFLEFPKIELHGSVPQVVADCYKEASRIKLLAPNAFATQIRRALEAICEDRAAPGDTLQKKLSVLVERGEIPATLGQMSDILRLVGNIGAHVAEQKIKPLQVLAIDDFFKAIIEYIYVAPSKLSDFHIKQSNVEEKE